MSKKADAWDDDWIQKTDVGHPSNVMTICIPNNLFETQPVTPKPAQSATKLSKQERRAKQAEFNKQIWQDAEKEQEDNYFLRAHDVVPLKSDFKPTMKVLSRKPNAKTGATLDGIGQLNLEDDDDDDDDAAKTVLTPEQQKEKAQREREEKAKAYEQRRWELFGNGDSLNGAASSKRGGPGGSPRNQSRANRGNDSRPSSAASSSARQLFDPSESPKPDHMRPQREVQPNEMQPIRQPTMPDASGPKSFGFATRGGRTN